MVENQWGLANHQFARQVHVRDHSGVTRHRIVIDPGCWAALVQGGIQQHHLSPGTYVLDSLWEKLKFWSPTQGTAILLRQEEQRLDVTVPAIPTKDHLFVNVELSIGVQMKVDDVMIFVKSLMGTNREVTISQLKDAFTPLIGQMLRQSVRQRTIEELTGPHTQKFIRDDLNRDLQDIFKQYGLSLATLHSIKSTCPQYEALLRQRGEQALREKQIEFDEAEFEAAKRQETLEVVKSRMKTNRMGENADKLIQRMTIRQKVRDFVRQEKLKNLVAEEDVRRKLHERDKHELLKAREIEEMTAGWKNDEAARRRLLEKLDLEHEIDLKTLLSEFDREEEMKTCRHGIELKRNADLLDDERARTQLNRELESIERRWQANFHREQQAWEFELKRRRDEINARYEQMRQDIDREESLRQIRDASKDRKIDQAVKLAREKAQLREHSANAESARQLEQAKSANAHELNLIDARRGATEAELMASVDLENAKVIAQVKVSEQEERTKQIVSEEARQVEREAHATQDQIRKEQIEQARRSSQEGQENARYAIDAISDIAKAYSQNGSPSSTHNSTGSAPQTPSDAATKVCICTNCRTENPPEHKACSNCGAPI